MWRPQKKIKTTTSSATLWSWNDHRLSVEQERTTRNRKKTLTEDRREWTRKIRTECANPANMFECIVVCHPSLSTQRHFDRASLDNINLTKVLELSDEPSREFPDSRYLRSIAPSMLVQATRASGGWKYFPRCVPSVNIGGAMLRKYLRSWMCMWCVLSTCPLCFSFLFQVNIDEGRSFKKWTIGFLVVIVELACVLTQL